MRVVFFLLALVLCTSSLLAQIPKDLGIHTPWVPASIVLTNGLKYNSEAQHNEYLGTITIKSANGDSVTISEDRIEKMSYRDPSTGVLRRFQRFEYYSEETTKTYDLLFEIIKDFPTFAVLSRSLGANALGTYTGSDFYLDAFRKNKTVIGTGSLLLFVGEDSKIKIYLKEVHIEWKELFHDRNKSKSEIVNEGLLKQNMKEHYDTVMKHVRQRKIKLTTREGVLEALEYYQTLLK